MLAELRALEQRREALDRRAADPQRRERAGEVLERRLGRPAREPVRRARAPSARRPGSPRGAGRGRARGRRATGRLRRAARPASSGSSSGVAARAGATPSRPLASTTSAEQRVAPPVDRRHPRSTCRGRPPVPAPEVGSLHGVAVCARQQRDHEQRDPDRGGDREQAEHAHPPRRRLSGAGVGARAAAARRLRRRSAGMTQRHHQSSAKPTTSRSPEVRGRDRRSAAGRRRPRAPSGSRARPRRRAGARAPPGAQPASGRRPWPPPSQVLLDSGLRHRRCILAATASRSHARLGRPPRPAG